MLSDASGIVSAWDLQARDQLPWSELPDGLERADGLAGLIIGTLEASICRPRDGQAFQTSFFAAVAHGRVRRHQAMPAESIKAEYQLLSEKTIAYLRAKYGPEAFADRESAIQEAYALAATGSEHGFHHSASEESWGAMVDSLAERSQQSAREAIEGRS